MTALQPPGKVNAVTDSGGGQTDLSLVFGIRLHPNPVGRLTTGGAVGAGEGMGPGVGVGVGSGAGLEAVGSVAGEFKLAASPTRISD